MKGPEVLGDFGFAEYEEFLARDDADICGTPLALSPEVCERWADALAFRTFLVCQGSTFVHFDCF